MDRLPAAARGPLFLRQLQGYPATGLPIQPIAGLAVLLTKQLDADSSKQIFAELKDRIQKAVTQQPLYARSIASYLSGVSTSLTKNFDRSNAGFLADLDRFLTESYADAFPKGVFTALVQANSATTGLDLAAVLDGVIRQVAQVQFPPDYPAASMAAYIQRNLATYNDQIFPHRKAEFLALLEKKSAEPGQPAPLMFAFTYAVYLSDPAGDPREMIGWLERTRERSPDHRLALEALYPLYRQLGDSERERQVLERLIALAPEAENFRQQLANLWRTLDHPESALQALGGKPRAGSAAATARDPNLIGVSQLTYASLGAAQVNKLA
jgi:hypothetical protein